LQQFYPSEGVDRIKDDELNGLENLGEEDEAEVSMRNFYIVLDKQPKLTNYSTMMSQAAGNTPASKEPMSIQSCSAKASESATKHLI
jgi:hypothetical protein